jgi:hypothetical protein
MLETVEPVTRLIIFVILATLLKNALPPGGTEKS